MYIGYSYVFVLALALVFALALVLVFALVWLWSFGFFVVLTWFLSTVFQNSKTRPNNKKQAPKDVQK